MQEKIKKIKMLIVDVDGVLTDGRIIYDNSGNDIKRFNVHDGFGFTLLKKAGIKSAIISAKGAKAVERRAKDMKISSVILNSDDKLGSYKNILAESGLKDDECSYIGDDLMDLPVMKRVGFAVAVPDAVDELKRAADYVTQRRGGRGAVREVIELILKTQGLWDKVVSEYVQ